MLTKRQKQILDFITHYNKRYGVSPALEEIKRHFRLRSVSNIHQHIETLKNKGYLNKAENQPRGIEIRKSIGLIQIPLLGLITAGQPLTIFDIDNRETIAVPKSRVPSSGEIYALKVAGDSMIDENINDGDIVLVKHQSTAENGQKVVAIVDGSDTTLKKFYQEKNQIRLQPANKNIEPIIIKKGREFEIQGIFVDVIKTENSAPEISEKPLKESIEKYDKLPLDEIICGDAVEELQKLPNGSIDLIITDPPYGISRELNCKGRRLGTTAKLNFNFGTWDVFNKEWFDIALKKTKGWMMTFCAKKDVGFFIGGLEKNGFIAIDVLVWQKPDPIPLNAKSRFLNAWEAIVIGKKPGAIWNSNYEHNIIKIQAPKGKNRIHPTQKPVELIKKLINLTTKEGNIVLDPFMGSGTTAIACLETKRSYIGFEISKQYWKQSLERIENLSKKLF